MFDIGFFEVILVFVVMLLVFKPEDLPGIVKSIGKTIGHIRNAINKLTI